MGNDFASLLQEAVVVHGHLCAGQVIGVRMAMLGLKEISIFDPKGADRKKLMVMVEIDRCATDAIQSVTGCSLGKRTLKFLDLGIMAASFLNLETGKAVRITALEEARHKVGRYCPEILDKYQQQLAAYKVMPEEELFRLQQVQVIVADIDKPGRPLRRVQCANCLDWVQDGREIVEDNKIYCRSCIDGRYYQLIG